MDETGEKVLVSHYERYLIGVSLIGILVSVIIGIATAQRGMMPWADIARAAECITAQSVVGTGTSLRLFFPAKALPSVDKPNIIHARASTSLA